MRNRGDSDGVNRFTTALATNIKSLRVDAEEERRAERAAISPIAGAADAIEAAPPAQSAWQPEYLSPERIAQREAEDPTGMLRQMRVIEERQRHGR